MVSKIAEKSKVTRVISFAAGDPDPDVIPRALYANLAKRVFEEERKSVTYSPTEGIPELREEITRFMGMYEGVEASPSDIIVTVGGSQALDLIGKLMMDPGDIVIVENPSYVNTLLVWKPYGVRLIGIPMDENGMDTHLLESKLRELKADGKFPKLIYTIPTGQNPTGITMSLDRRKHLYEIASQYDLLIVEDGAYNQLVYEQVEVKSIKSMDVEGRVIFVGSFSKVLGTGLRVGWLHLPRELVDVFKATKGPADMCAPVPSQLIVYRILREGLFKEIKENAIKAYKEKRDLMLDAIDKYLHVIKHTHPVAGMFIFLWLPEHIDGWRLAEEVLEKKAVATIPGAPFYTDQTGRNTLRLNFSMAPRDLIDRGVRDLSEFIK
ncbi:MAG: PLP-dependent aminotransferase family protein [Thermosphaera sp.]|nr:PLP-dependent aminotransferase family protein [Thermosphaera sp.]